MVVLLKNFAGQNKISAFKSVGKQRPKPNLEKWPIVQQTKSEYLVFIAGIQHLLFAIADHVQILLLVTFVCCPI